MAGPVGLAAGLVALRIVAGVTAGAAVLGDRRAARLFFLIPFWDVWAFADLCSGSGWEPVEWRGQRMTLSRDGRIVRVE